MPNGRSAPPTRRSLLCGEPWNPPTPLDATPVDAPSAASTKSDIGVKSGPLGPHVPAEGLRQRTGPAPTTMPGWPHASVLPNRRLPGAGSDVPYPLGATYDGSGHQLLAVLQRRRGCRAVPARAERRPRRGPHPADRGRRPLLARLPPRRPPRPALRLPRARAVGTRPRACGATRPSCLLDPYAKAIDGEVDWDPACFAYDFDDPDEMNTADSAPHVPARRRVRPVLRLGQRPPAGPRDARLDHLRGPRQGPHPAPSRRPRRDARARTPGIAHPAVVEHLASLGITAIELMPVHQFVHDHHLVERGLRNYWGYNSIAFLAPHNGYTVSGHGGSPGELPAGHRRPAPEPGAGVQDDGQGAAQRRASRSSSTSSTTTRPRATTWGRCCRCAASTTSPTTG